MTPYPYPLVTVLPQANLVWLLDASVGVTTVGGGDDTVTLWEDQRGTNDMDVVTGDPQLVTGGINGNSYIAFDGAGDTLQRTASITLPSGASERTLITVQDYHSSGVGGVAYGNAANNQTFGNAVNSSGFLMFQRFGVAFDLVATGVSGVSADIQVQTSHLTAGIGQRVFRNTTNVASDVAPAASNTVNNVILFARDMDGSPDVAMDLYLVALYSPALSWGQILQAVRALRVRFATNYL